MEYVSYMVGNTLYKIYIPNENIMKVWEKMMCIMDDFIPSLATLKYAKEDDIYSYFYLSYLWKETPTLEITIYLSSVHYVEEIICAFAQMYDEHSGSHDLNYFIDLFLFHRHQNNTIQRKLRYEYETKSLMLFDLSDTYSLIDFVIDLLDIEKE